MTGMKERTAVVIGAGVAGLAAARHLVQAGVQVTVLEKAAYAGGRVHTEVFDDFQMERCAEFFTNFYDLTRSLIRELGLQHEIVRIPGKVAVARAGRLYKLWPPSLGLVLTRLLSFRSKLLLLKLVGPVLLSWNKLDIHAPEKASALDTRSVAAYTRQVLDDELLDYLFEPALIGLSYWVPEHTSQVHLFLMLKLLPRMEFFTLRHGMGCLPEALAAHLPIRYQTEAMRVTSNRHDRYTVEADVKGKLCEFSADGIVCATPASIVPELFPQLTTTQRQFFAAVTYSSTVKCSFGVDHRLSSDLYGIFYPRREVKHLASVLIQSGKSPGQVRAGRDSITLCASGPAARALLDKDDAFIQATLLADLRQTDFPFDLDGQMLFSRVHRVPLALPDCDVGHYQRLKMFADGEIEPSRVVFAGDYLGGPLIEGAVTSGIRAANRLLCSIQT